MALGAAVGGSSQGLNSDVNAVFAMLQASTDYARVRNAVKEAVTTPAMPFTSPEDFEKQVRRLMEDSGLANRIRNFAFAARGKIPGVDVSHHERGVLGVVPVNPPAATSNSSRARTCESDPNVGLTGTENDASGTSDSDDAREASGASSAIMAARRTLRRTVVTRLLRLAETTGVPLSARNPAEESTGCDSKSAKGQRRRRQTVWETADPVDPEQSSHQNQSIQAALELAAFTGMLPRHVGHVWDHDDLFDAAVSGTFAENAKQKTQKVLSENASETGLLSLRKPPSGRDIQRFLRDLAPNTQKSGTDDSWDVTFSTTRKDLAEKLLNAKRNQNQNQNQTDFCIFLRGGAPAEHRAVLWRAALGIAGGAYTKSFREDFNRIVSDARPTTMLTDALCASDAKETCDHPFFFPFDETLRAALVCFSRDASVPELCAVNGVRPHHPSIRRVSQSDGEGEETNEQESESYGEARKNKKETNAGPYPPSGVVPFRGLAKLMAPLCFLYEHPGDIAGVFKHLWVSIFSRLHVIDDDAFPKPAFPGLLAMVEEQITEHEPELQFHLAKISCHVSKLTTPWLAGGFAGFLPVTETLLLWDRLVGFQSLLPLGVAACAILSLRKNALLAATNTTEAFECVEDLSFVKIEPLLAAFALRNGKSREEGCEGSEGSEAEGSSEESQGSEGSESQDSEESREGSYAFELSDESETDEATGY